MPNLKLTNLASIKTYFAALAISHVDIDGFKYGSLEVIQNDNRSDLLDKTLWVGWYEDVKFRDAFSDNVTRVKPISVVYMRRPGSEKFADEDAILEACEAVIDQIIAKMAKDKRGGMVGANYEMVAMNIASIKTGPVQKNIGSTKWIGWEMKIEFLDNSNMEYDAAKWV